MQKINVLEMIDQPFLGGGQKNLLTLAESLDKSIFNVSICSKADGPLVNAAKKRDIPHFPVSFSKRFDRNVIEDIGVIMQKSRIAILHTHGGVAGFYGRWAARRCGVPVVIHTLHGIHYLHYRNILMKHVYILMEKSFSRFTDALVFVSQDDLMKGKKHKLSPEEKMVLIKNGIDFTDFAERVKDLDTRKYAQEVLEVDPEDLVVGTIARLHRQKGIPTLLRAAQTIRKAVPRVKIVVVGGGPLKQKMESLSKRCGNEDFVSILGEREDAQKLLTVFDVFVLPSLWEGLPYVLMEAAALSKPVVATGVEGTREIIKDGQTGILVPTQSPESLAQGVISLLQDREQAIRFGKSLREDLCARYSISEMVQKIQALYLEIFEKKQRIQNGLEAAYRSR